MFVARCLGKNILCNSNGVIKLADFGSAKRFTNVMSKDAPSLSYNYTPLWTAPEVLVGDYNSKVDSQKHTHTQTKQTKTKRKQRRWRAWMGSWTISTAGPRKMEPFECCVRSLIHFFYSSLSVRSAWPPLFPPLPFPQSGLSAA